MDSRLRAAWILRRARAASLACALLACSSPSNDSSPVAPDASSPDASARTFVTPSFFVAAYYAPLTHAKIPVDDIDFASFTHLNYFGLKPTAAGNLVGSINTSVVHAAHRADRPVLLTVGGSSSQVGFEGGMAAPNRAHFVASILAQVSAGDFDGVDLDMEPITPNDDADLAAFVHDLRAALPRPMLLTSTLQWELDLFASIQDSFDRLSLLAYHLTSDTDVTWHNAALYSPSLRQESTGEPLPSCDSALASALAAGIAPGKMTLGIDFNGDVWSGASEPNVSGRDLRFASQTFSQIADTYLPSAVYHWDDAARVPYLSVAASDGGAPLFVTYDDARSVTEKVAYAVARHLGGVMLWNLGAGYRVSEPSGMRNPLLTSVADAVSASPPVDGGH